MSCKLYHFKRNILIWKYVFRKIWNCIPSIWIVEFKKSPRNVGWRKRDDRFVYWLESGRGWNHHRRGTTWLYKVCFSCELDSSIQIMNFSYQYLSDIGGTAGLVLGLSIASIFEYFESFYYLNRRKIKNFLLHLFQFKWFSSKEQTEISFQK